MAYFIKINESYFKVPNRLIVGRGEPFTVLNDDRSVARSHLLLLQKGKKFYVKDLGTESGSWVNGTRIKTKKLIEVKPDEAIKIGDSSLTVLSAKTVPEFVEIKGNSLRVDTSDINYSYIISALLVGLALMNVHSSWKEGKSIGFLLFFFIAQLAFVGFMGFLISKWFKLLKSMTPNQILKDAYFSDEGFTVHYTEGGNMTFKTEKIEAWNLGNHLIEVQIYGEKHIMAPTKDQLRIFEVYFNKHLKSKKIIETRSRAGTYAYVACLGLMLLTVEFQMFFQLGIAAAGLIFMASAALLAKPELRKHWIIPANRNFSQSKQFKSIVFSCLFALYSMHLMISNKDLVANVEACSGRDARSCKELDFYKVKSNELKVSQETVAFACEQGNKSACSLRTNRKIASEKNQE